MAKSIRDQLLDSGTVKQSETSEGRRAAAMDKARVPVEEKASPPPFEAPARGVVGSARTQERAAALCEDCGAKLPSQRATAGLLQCAECAADQR